MRIASNIESIGQIFMAGMPGTTLDAGTEALIRNYALGGVILFSRNIENPLQLASLCNELQDRALRAHGTPLFLAIDQEGGQVARLKEPFSVFPGNTVISKDPNAVDLAKTFASITAKEMRLVGLNMNFAPVMDVLRGNPEKHLVGRTFGADPQKTARLGSTVIRVMQSNGVMATAKHFPGLGRATLDPHHELPVIDASEKEIEQIHLPPFSSAIAQGVSSIMTSHALYPSLDPEYPATLSYKIMTGLLRDVMGFKGLLISDDLEMGAIKKGRTVAEGAVASFMAGADVLLICQEQDRVLKSIKLLGHKIVESETARHRFEQSIGRIIKAKSSFLKNYQKIVLADVHTYFS